MELFRLTRSLPSQSSDKSGAMGELSRELRTRWRGWTRPWCWRQPPWCRTWAGSREIDIALSASRPTTRAVAEILSNERVVSLHSRCCAGVALIHRTVDHIKATLPLVQPQFVVGMLASVVVIDGAPFDVQDSMRRNAGNRGVDATGATGVSRAARVCICALVIPVREDGEVVAEPRQANVSPGVIRCGKLRIAVGRQID